MGCAHCCCTEHAPDAWAPVALTWSVIRPGDIILVARTRSAPPAGRGQHPEPLLLRNVTFLTLCNDMYN